MATVCLQNNKKLPNLFNKFNLKGLSHENKGKRLLYIIRKLFSRPIIAGHKILISLKGNFTIIKNPSSVSKAGSYYFVLTM